MAFFSLRPLFNIITTEIYDLVRHTDAQHYELTFSCHENRVKLYADGEVIFNRSTYCQPNRKYVGISHFPITIERKGDRDPKVVVSAISIYHNYDQRVEAA